MTDLIGHALTQVEGESFKTYYDFIKQYDNVPSKEKIFLTIKQSRNSNEAINKVNLLFAKALKRALLFELDKEQAQRIKHLLTVQINIDKDTLATTEVRVKYGEFDFPNPMFEQLIFICELLQRDAKAIWFNGIHFAQAINMAVTNEVADKIKAVVEEGICEPIADSSSNHVKKLIVELDFIADRIQTNSNFYEYQEHIWEVLNDFNEVLGEMRKFKPSYLILYASDDN